MHILKNVHLHLEEKFFPKFKKFSRFRVFKLILNVTPPFVNSTTFLCDWNSFLHRSLFKELLGVYEVLNPDSGSLCRVEFHRKSEFQTKETNGVNI